MTALFGLVWDIFSLIEMLRGLFFGRLLEREAFYGIKNDRYLTEFISFEAEY